MRPFTVLLALLTINAGATPLTLARQANVDLVLRDVPGLTRGCGFKTIEGVNEVLFPTGRADLLLVGLGQGAYVVRVHDQRTERLACFGIGGGRGWPGRVLVRLPFKTPWDAYAVRQSDAVQRRLDAAGRAQCTRIIPDGQHNTIWPSIAPPLPGCHGKTIVQRLR